MVEEEIDERVKFYDKEAFKLEECLDIKLINKIDFKYDDEKKEEIR